MPKATPPCLLKCEEVELNPNSRMQPTQQHFAPNIKTIKGLALPEAEGDRQQTEAAERLEDGKVGVVSGGCALLLSPTLNVKLFVDCSRC
jgi:hypothetical protein